MLRFLGDWLQNITSSTSIKSLEPGDKSLLESNYNRMQDSRKTPFEPLGVDTYYTAYMNRNKGVAEIFNQRYDLALL